MSKNAILGIEIKTKTAKLLSQASRGESILMLF
jgi:hypothetical protein